MARRVTREVSGSTNHNVGAPSGPALTALSGTGLTAELPRATSLVIKLCHTEGDAEPWSLSAFNDTDWDIGPYDSVTKEQTFSAAGETTADVMIILNGTGFGVVPAATVEYYENGATEPTRSKAITWTDPQ